MNVAHALLHSLAASGVEWTCFADPGTSEMHVVAALDEVRAGAVMWAGSQPFVAGDRRFTAQLPDRAGSIPRMWT